VDDGLFFSLRSGQGTQECDTDMQTVAEALEEIGFVVPERQGSEVSVKKMVGYDLDLRARWSLPAQKAEDLRTSLLWLAAARQVDTRLLHSLVGVWVWAALLARRWLSVPSAVFKFLEKYPSLRVPWWASARREVVVMAHVTATLYYDMSKPVSPWVLASDAEGVNDKDFGGYGVMCAYAGAELVEEVLRRGTRAGRTITQLDGSVERLARRGKELLAKVSVSRLPPAIFTLDWLPLVAARWRAPDHIMLGEGRGSLVALERLAATPKAWFRVVVSLMDNEPWSSAASKGRSPAVMPNALLRKKAALETVTGIDLELPWTDTARQPADSLSRLRDTRGIQFV